MIIDIDGILKGQRLRKCTGDSRWHYAYYLLLANNYARLELDYDSIAEHFVSFRGSNPSPEDILRDFSEYQECHLAFVYTSGNRVWAQFDTKRSNTKNYRTAADKRSPAPPESDYQSWLREQHPEDWGAYHWNPSPEIVKTQVQPNQTVIKSLEKVTNISEKFSGGVGVGVGEGDGKKRRSKTPVRRAHGNPNASQVAKASGENRHSRSQQIVMGWYQDWAGVECPWGGPEAGNLSKMLKSWPGANDEQFVRCLENIARSDCIPKGTRPGEWLCKLPKFLHGPLDQFWKSKQVSNGNSKAEQRSAEIRESTGRIFDPARVLHGNDSAGLQEQAGGRGADPLAGHALPQSGAIHDARSERRDERPHRTSPIAAD